MKKKFSFDDLNGSCDFRTLICANGQVHGIFLIDEEEEIRFSVDLDDLLETKFKEIAQQYKDDVEVLYG